MRYDTVLFAFGLAACLLVTATSWAQVKGDPRPLIFISESDTECGNLPDHTSPPWIGERSLYVWVCGGFNWFGMTEFGVETTLQVVDLIPRSGVTNIGSITSPTLIYPQCEPWMLLAELVVLDGTGGGGRVCLTDSETHLMNCTQDCGGQLFANIFTGFSSDGTPPCSGMANSPGCSTVAVDRPSWGSVKSLYR